MSHKHTNKSLPIESNLFKNILDDAEAYIYTKDTKERYTYANSLVLNLFNLSLEELLGKQDKHFFLDSHALKTHLHDRRVLDFGETIEIEQTDKLRSNGKTLHFWSKKKPILDDTGNIIGISGISIDITARKKMETQCSELLLEFNSITNNIPDILLKTKIDGSLVWYNSQLEKITGLSSDKLNQIPINQLVIDTEIKKIENSISRTKKRGKDTVEITLKTVYGPRIFLLKSFILNDIDDKPLGITCIATNINQQRKLEKALETIVKATAFQTGKGFFIELVKLLTETLNITYAFVGKLTGKDNQTVKTIAVCNNGHIDDNFSYNIQGTPYAETVLKSSCVYIKDIQSLFPKDKLLIQMDMESYAGITLFDSNNQALGLIVMLDTKPMIDELIISSIISHFSIRAAVEIERIDSEIKLRQTSAVFENSDEGIAILDSDFNIIDINTSYKLITGYCKEEVLGIPPDFLNSELQESQFYECIYLTLKSKGFWQGEIWNQRKNGETYPEWLTISVIKDDENLVINYIAVFSDITKLIKAEKKHQDLQQQLLQSQKMESLGLLTGGIAHDFNNVLTSILGYSELAKNINFQNKEEELSDYIHEIILSANRAKDLVSQMLTFSRAKQGSKVTINLADIVADTVKMLRPMLSSSVQVLFNLEHHFPLLKADPIQINQLIMNLCINAKDALNNTGKIKITLSTTILNNKVCNSCHQNILGKYIVISVSDTGTGIEENNINKLFDPFFTTKEVGKGTGMGLSVVHGIVHDHSGHIIVKSEVNIGTTFQILFPYPIKIHENLSSKTHRLISPISHSNNEVMIIDDEASICNFMKVLLENNNYKVTTCTNSELALAIFKENPKQFDLVITDQTMPNMNGEELSKQLLKINPNVPIILCSGYNNSNLEQSIKNIGIKAFLCKPVDSNNLILTVNNVLLSHSQIGY